MVYSASCGVSMSFVFKPSRHANTASCEARRFALRVAFAITLALGFPPRYCAQTISQMHPAKGAPTPLASTSEQSSNPPSVQNPVSAPNPASVQNSAAPVPVADLSRYSISPGDVLDV